MSDMRLVIAGAGGRMGRTLVNAIAATKGVTLAGAVDAPDSPMIGRDAGELAGLGPNGIKIVSDVTPLLKAADGLIEFVVPSSHWRLPKGRPPPVLCTLSARPGIRPRRKPPSSRRPPARRSSNPAT
jgi:hypothetical protein